MKTTAKDATLNGHANGRRRTIDYALDYLSAGRCVLPIRGDGSKSPTIAWKEFETRRPTKSEVKRWLIADNVGVAILHGAVSGNSECIDVDNGDVFEPYCEEVRRVAPGLIERLTTIKTPRDGGGYHLVYQCSEIEGSQGLAFRPNPSDGNKPKKIIESKGEGGYALAPGCPGCCHETGGHYEHVGGPPLTKLTTITPEERAILFRVARTFDECPAEPSGPKPSSSTERGSGLSPGDDFNARASWDEILIHHEWKRDHERGGIGYWRRPGKPVGWSATTGIKSTSGTELFCCFSDNAHPFAGATGKSPCTTYSKFAAYAVLNHNGDFSAAAKQLASEGYGEQRRERVWIGDKSYDVDHPVAQAAIAAKAAVKATPSFAGIDAADLQECVNQPVDWVVEDVDSADQTSIFGARSKAGKTTQLADRSVALTTGTPWLGVFIVPRVRRTLFITGEANNRAISRRLDRACRARGKTLADTRGKLRVEALNFPQLPRIKDQEAVARTVSDFGIEEVIVDPLYRGLAGLDSGKVTEIGGAIVDFAQACRPAHLTISHHCIKPSAREYGKAPELEDLTGAGVAECCGNWWLIGRNTPYEFDGMHDLCVTYGGRDEQSGSRRILFDERAWTFDVEPLHQYREAAADAAASERQRQKDDADQRQVDMARAKIKATLANERTPVAKTAIRETCGATRRWFEAAFGQMRRDQQIVAKPYRDLVGRVHAAGYLLREHAERYQFEPN